MELDENVRYATICDLNGKQLCAHKREGVVNYLSDEETKESLQNAISSWKSRMKLYDKIGKGKYVLAVYEKLRRITMPLKDDNLLLVTIDNYGGQMDIINKIQNQLHGDYVNY